ncbi:two-component system response regulator PrmA [Marinobacter nanhaiticus D15-8W]|uniref:DNA-binding response regulator n=1 Tax=Marinobacter nanhaiticus D15-8W TaxID=626887 RepID=N6WTY1_9GAMM|nr:response regulator transcription factor [Marinobacter nanhaiticus]ENO14986.1 DNA-binding response regulator [Marinobacter nanhaiticus D15-8W]BES69318.1 two-component system response regulator PrmA [Marinobacter nanhaiticus D15-8W]
MRILLVEDDHPLARTMLGMLREQYDTVDWIDDGDQALSALTNEHFDLVLLDLTLPRRDGLDILRAIRQKGVHTPAIILTARGDIEEKLRGLDAGADDYVTKPFVMAELKARIRAVTRRAEGKADSSLVVGQLSLDTQHGQLRINCEPCALPRAEFQILHYLMRHPDQVATRRRLEEQLYGWDQGAESNALEVHVHHLRRRIGKAMIRTVRGVGYVLDSAAASRVDGA